VYGPINQINVQFLSLILHILTRFLSSRVSYFKVVYLTMPSVSRLCGVSDRMIHEYGEIGGMRNARGNRNTSREPAAVNLIATNHT
jgi:hypothetical protein